MNGLRHRKRPLLPNDEDDNLVHPDAIARRACRHGWDVETLTGPVIILRRQAWRLEITFADDIPIAASVASPDGDRSGPVNLRSINALTRARPDEIALRAAASIVGRQPSHAERA
ncbi:hypothetical protein [Nonomuraea insulae]|uniref:Uncharacterized protein n=1 Tax=Nonomuraea insulae TaxID=1616787 RepID=A0ABW1D6D3_9ACTN